jgi:hypothetical protein
MEQGSSSEDENIPSDIQEISRTSPPFYYLGQMEPIRALSDLYLRPIRHLPICVYVFQVVASFRFHHQNSVFISLLSRTCHSISVSTHLV